LFTRYADWRKFLQGARQRTYKKGEYVLKEGQPTAALFQIVSGTLRVELQIKDKAQAVIVGYRQAGDMFGETSLLKSGVATASIAAESEAVVMCLEGSYLEELFQESPGLPGRFFCFIAAYEAERLYQLTKGAADSKKPKVTVSNSVRVSLDEIMANRAYSVPTAIRTEALATAERCAAADPVWHRAWQGVLRKYLTSVDPKSSTFQNDNPSIAIGSFDLAVMASEFEKLPHMAALMKEVRIGHAHARPNALSAVSAEPAASTTPAALVSP
jgi:CRP-like cAMP-binding protein